MVLLWRDTNLHTSHWNTKLLQRFFSWTFDPKQKCTERILLLLWKYFCPCVNETSASIATKAKINILPSKFNPNGIARYVSQRGVTLRSSNQRIQSVAHPNSKCLLQLIRVTPSEVYERLPIFQPWNGSDGSCQILSLRFSHLFLSFFFFFWRFIGSLFRRINLDSAATVLKWHLLFLRWYWLVFQSKKSIGVFRKSSLHPLNVGNTARVECGDVQGCEFRDSAVIEHSFPSVLLFVQVNIINPPPSSTYFSPRNHVNYKEVAGKGWLTGEVWHTVALWWEDTSASRFVGNRWNCDIPRI